MLERIRLAATKDNRLDGTEDVGTFEYSTGSEGKAY